MRLSKGCFLPLFKPPVKVARSLYSMDFARLVPFPSSCGFPRRRSSFSEGLPPFTFSFCLFDFSYSRLLPPPRGLFFSPSPCPTVFFDASGSWRLLGGFPIGRILLPAFPRLLNPSLLVESPFPPLGWEGPPQPGNLPKIRPFRLIGSLFFSLSFLLAPIGWLSWPPRLATALLDGPFFWPAELSLNGVVTFFDFLRFFFSSRTSTFAHGLEGCVGLRQPLNFFFFPSLRPRSPKSPPSPAFPLLVSL